MANGTVLYGPRGEEISTPQTRRLSAIQNQQNAIKARFDAAQTTTENSRYWAQADYLGPNAELNAYVRRQLRSRARYECANNSYAGGLVRTLANDTIGTGPSVVITDQWNSKDDATLTESLFWQWCLSVNAPEKLRTMRLAKARDGEAFAQIFTNPRATTEVQFDFKPFEADYVSATNVETALTSLLDGLIIDDHGNVIAYNVRDEHPGELSTMLWGESELIRAELIIHLFHSERPGQYRGVTELLSSLPLYAQLRRYTLAVLRASESAAIPSWIIETAGDAASDPEAFDTVETERGMGLTLPKGSKMSQLHAEHPTSTYPQFKREIVSEAARGPGVPYYKASGDSSSYNYSSVRCDNQTYYKSIRVERSKWETGACDRLFAGWWDEARRIPNFLPEVARKQLPGHEWRWDGEEHVDPVKESTATVTRVSYGMTSRRDEVGRLGGDIDVIDQQNADSFGLSKEEYRKRLADKFFGATVASSSQDVPEEPASNPNHNGGQNG